MRYAGITDPSAFRDVALAHVLAWSWAISSVPASVASWQPWQEADCGIC